MSRAGSTPAYLADPSLQVTVSVPRSRAKLVALDRGAINVISSLLSESAAQEKAVETGGMDREVKAALGGR